MRETTFSVANTTALLGCAALIVSLFAPRLRPALHGFAGFVVPAMLGLAYLALIAVFWSRAEGGFGSLAAVNDLFHSPGLLLAGWLHYLAFDLFVGAWIARAGAVAGIGTLWLLPCFALTFLFGPAGFLLFLAVRAAHAGPAHAEGGEFAR